VNLIICDSNGNDIVSVAWYTYGHIKAELIVHYDQWFLITLYACPLSQALYMIQPNTFLHLSNNSNNTQWYNLWSYTLCSFLQYPITFRHKRLWTNQHCSQTQSTAFPQCHSQIVTPTAIKILCKHTYVGISIFMLSESRKETK